MSFCQKMVSIPPTSRGWNTPEWSRASPFSACSTAYYTGDTISGPAQRMKRDADGNLLDPLRDAPNRSLMTCTSEAPVTVLQRVGEVPFACPALGVSATLDELRDAGWRILRLDIGEDLESDSHVVFPVTVQVRKLF